MCVCVNGECVCVCVCALAIIGKYIQMIAPVLAKCGCLYVTMHCIRTIVSSRYEYME